MVSFINSGIAPYAVAIRNSRTGFQVARFVRLLTQRGMI